MKACFALKDGAVIPAVAGDLPGASIIVYATPDEGEKREIVEELRLDPYDIESSLDPDEISRVEFTPDCISLFWKQPKNVSFSAQIRFDVSSMGFFLRGDTLIVITGNDDIPFSGKEFQCSSSPCEVLFKFLLHTVHHYLGHLKAIKQLNAEIESKIISSMENRYLLQVFALSESLIYYLSAIEANGAVLSKLRGSAEKLGFTKDQIEFLDEISLENQQCSRQAQIYSTVLSGLMDARGTIINNNMNVLLKNLTLINVIFLPLNLIAGIGGMSEFSMMTHSYDWKVAYTVFALCMLLVAWATWFILMRALHPNRPSNAGPMR